MHEQPYIKTMLEDPRNELREWEDETQDAEDQISDAHVQMASKTKLGGG